MKINKYITIIYVFAFFFALRAHALTVSPAKIEITADPGRVVTDQIVIFNEESETRTFYLTAENFESRGDTGAPYFVGANDGLATWIQTDSSVTIEPGQRIPVPYSIFVPNNAKAGGYFAAIFFGSQPPTGSDAGEVSIGGKIGVLVLLSVSGDVEESAGLSGFTTANENKFFDGLPVDFAFTFNNDGGDRVVPKC